MNSLKGIRTSRSFGVSRRHVRPILVSFCLLIFVAAIVALPGTMRRANAQSGQDKSKTPPTIPTITPPTGQDDEEEGDADIPPRLKGKIDKDAYLGLRTQFTSLLRGIDLEAKPIDPALRARALEQMLAQEGNSPNVNSSSWTEIGPFPLPNGQSQQFPTTISVSGRVTSVAVDPSNSNKVYLGTAQGGVWRSTNGGTTWTPIFDTAQSLSIGAIAVAPSNPSIVYVGTGEPNNSGDCFFGVGVYRIDNADTTANLTGPINPLITTGTTTALTYNCFSGRAISKILVNPSDPATIFVSTGTGLGGIGSNSLSNTIPPLALRGVFRSTNATAAAGTVTFTKLIVNTDGSLDVPGTGNTSIFDMVLEPGNANNLLVAPSGTTTGGGVWRSTNALSATPTFTNTLFPGFNGLVHRLSINKVGAVVTVYVSSNETSGNATCSSAGNAGRLRKSTDGGLTWSTPLAGAEGYCGGQCSYDNPVGVDPNNANIVYLGGNARGTCSDVLKKSTDGGATFARDDTGLHADSHTISFDPLTAPTTVWFGNDGGIWKRQDAVVGTAWLNQNNAPLGSMQFQSLAVHPTDQNFTIGGTQDNGTEAQQTTPGNWTSAEGGDGGFALIDQSATNTTNVTMYHTFFNLRNSLIGFDRTNLGTCLATKDSWASRGFGFGTDPTLSCDGTAFAAGNGITGTDFVNFYAPMALGPGTPNTFYFGTDRLYRSTNRGDTMTVVSQAPFVASTPVSAIGISRTNDNVRIVGTVNGVVFSTTTGANPMDNAAFPTPTNATASATNRYISRAVIDPTTSNTAYVTLAYYTNPSTAGQVWRTTNLNLGVSATWTSIGNTGTGLPNVPVNGIAIDANDPTHVGVSVLYVGSDIGVYRSTDSGGSWTPFGTGLPRSAVFDMAIQPTSRILRVATHGRGMWEIALPGSPTAAKLSSFNANVMDDGRVLIQWTTGAEVDNLGFNVYREQNGRRVRITPQLIAGSALLASATLTSGNSYVWFDTPPAAKSTKYLLEDLDLNGKSSWNGPIEIRSSGGKRSSASTQQRATLLTRMGLRDSQMSIGLGSAPDERTSKLRQDVQQDSFALAGGAAIKLSVNREGWYRVSQPELAAAGLDSKVNPRLLRMFADGREIPISIPGEVDGRFDASDSVEFFGTGLDAASSNTRVYWLAAGAQPGMRIEKVSGKGLTSASQGFAYTVERKDRTIYFGSLRNGDAENFFGPVIASEPVDQTLTVQHIDKGSVRDSLLEVTLQGVTKQFHKVRVQLNGADLGSVAFDGQSSGKATLNVSPSILKEGDNVVSLSAQVGEADVSLIDSLRITYQHSLVADSDALRFTVNGRQQVTVDGFSNGTVRLFDVSNPDAPQELTGAVKSQKGGYAVTATVPGSGPRTLLAFAEGRALRVVEARANQPSRWRQRSNGADLLIITHRDFKEALGNLVTHRQSQGLSVALVDVEDIYDEFSYGNKTPQSLRDFLAYANDNWKKAPTSVLLVGDSSLDPKNYLGYGDVDYVPTRLLDTQFMETESDAWLADFDGDDVEDLAIGRLPVRSVQEAAAMISKVISYDSAPRSESMLLVYDVNDGFDFKAANQALRGLIPSDVKVGEIDRVDGDAATKQRFIESVNSGQMIVNYSGHGSSTNWRGDFLTNEDALALQNSGRLSLFITMTCLNGYSQDPLKDALAEALMKSSHGGAVAVWASSGLTAPGNQILLNQQVYQALFSETRKNTLGQAVMKAKGQIQDADVRRTWILFGDPTTRIK